MPTNCSVDSKHELTISPITTDLCFIYSTVIMVSLKDVASARWAHLPRLQQPLTSSNPHPSFHTLPARASPYRDFPIMKMGCMALMALQALSPVLYLMVFMAPYSCQVNFLAILQCICTLFFKLLSHLP